MLAMVEGVGGGGGGEDGDVDDADSEEDSEEDNEDSEPRGVPSGTNAEAGTDFSANARTSTVSSKSEAKREMAKSRVCSFSRAALR